MAKGRERTQKWYFKNEAEVMKQLGLKPQPGSGNNWAHKQDGENDHILAQLKSTDKQQYTLKLLDIEKLEYDAMVAHKIPIFILQFLINDSRYALIKIEDIPKAAEFLETGQVTRNENDIIEGFTKPKRKAPSKTKKVKSSADARNAFYAEQEQERENRRWKK